MRVPRVLRGQRARSRCPGGRGGRGAQGAEGGWNWSPWGQLKVVEGPSLAICWGLEVPGVGGAGAVVRTGQGWVWN